MTLTTALTQAETLQDITDFIKEVRNLEKCKVLSFLVERKREANWLPKQLTTFITEVPTCFRCGLKGNVTVDRDRISQPEPNHKVHVDPCFQKVGKAPMGPNTPKKDRMEQMGTSDGEYQTFWEPEHEQRPRPETHSWEQRLWGQPAQRQQMSDPTSDYQCLSMDRPTS
jgi:hypothetical protein